MLQPVFKLAVDQEPEVSAAILDPVEKDLLAIEGWLQGLARVRSHMADLALVSAAAQWVTGAEPRLVPIQLPRRAGDDWAATGRPPASGDAMSVMAIDPPGAASATLEGLLIDEWTEIVPTAREITGLAFQFDRPSASAGPGDTPRRSAESRRALAVERTRGRRHRYV